MPITFSSEKYKPSYLLIFFCLALSAYSNYIHAGRDLDPIAQHFSDFLALPGQLSLNFKTKSTEDESRFVKSHSSSMPTYDDFTKLKNIFFLIMNHQGDTVLGDSILKCFGHVFSQILHPVVQNARSFSGELMQIDQEILDSLHKDFNVTQKYRYRKCTPLELQLQDIFDNDNLKKVEYKGTDLGTWALIAVFEIPYTASQKPGLQKLQFFHLEWEKIQTLFLEKSIKRRGSIPNSKQTLGKIIEQLDYKNEFDYLIFMRSLSLRVLEVIINPFSGTIEHLKKPEQIFAYMPVDTPASMRKCLMGLRANISESLPDSVASEASANENTYGFMRSLITAFGVGANLSIPITPAHMASGFTKMVCGVPEKKTQYQRLNLCSENCPEYRLRLELEMEVKKLRQQLDEKEMEEESGKACIICLEQFGTNCKRVMLDPCGHSEFCIKCIDSMEPIEYEDDTASWDSYGSYDYEVPSFLACPLCRSEIEKKAEIETGKH